MPPRLVRRFADPYNAHGARGQTRGWRAAAGFG